MRNNFLRESEWINIVTPIYTLPFNRMVSIETFGRLENVSFSSGDNQHFCVLCTIYFFVVGKHNINI